MTQELKRVLDTIMRPGFGEAAALASSPTPQATEAERAMARDLLPAFIGNAEIERFAQALASVREQERAACERASKRIAQKWHDIVSSPNTTTIGGACAAAAAEAAESIARAIRARKDSSHAEL